MVVLLLFIKFILKRERHRLLSVHSKINRWEKAMIHQRHHAIIKHLSNGLELQTQALDL